MILGTLCARAFSRMRTAKLIFGVCHVKVTLVGELLYKGRYEVLTGFLVQRMKAFTVVDKIFASFLGLTSMNLICFLVNICKLIKHPKFEPPNIGHSSRVQRSCQCDRNNYRFLPVRIAAFHYWRELIHHTQ
jgi:hypothetical protein